MVKALVFLFLAAQLSIQITHSAPTDSSEKALDEIANIFKQIAEHVEIIEVTFDELIELDDIVRENGKILLNKVLNDSKMLEVKSDTMEKIRKEIREYLDKLEKDDTDTKSRAIEYLNFEDLVNKYKNEKGENLTPEAVVVGNSLKENGLEDLEKKVADHFNEFAKNFVKQLSEFIAKLSEDDKKDEKKLLDWYDKFVAETDVNKKLLIFNEFFVSKDKKENSKED